jgi:hypothetical protein
MTVSNNMSEELKVMNGKLPYQKNASRCPGARRQ